MTNKAPEQQDGCAVYSTRDCPTVHTRLRNRACVDAATSVAADLLFGCNKL
jgi:hypothetical protein